MKKENTSVLQILEKAQKLQNKIGYFSTPELKKALSKLPPHSVPFHMQQTFKKKGFIKKEVYPEGYEGNKNTAIYTLTDKGLKHLEGLRGNNIIPKKSKEKWIDYSSLSKEDKTKKIIHLILVTANELQKKNGSFTTTTIKDNINNLSDHTIRYYLYKHVKAKGYIKETKIGCS